MDFEEKTLNSKQLLQTKVIDVRQDTVELVNGNESTRIVVEHPGGVVIVAQKSVDTILMVNQYRYPVKETSVELPAGRLEKGEDPLYAAQRELEEETGFRAKIWKSLGFINTTPGFCDERLYLYFATDLEFVGEHPDADEIIQAQEYKIDDIFKMIKNCQINDSKTICGLMRAFKL